VVTAVLLALALQATPWSVVVTRRVAVDPAEGLEMADRLSSSLERSAPALGHPLSAQAVAVLLAAASNPDSAVCAGKSDCAVALATLAKLERVVSLQLVRVGGNIVVDAVVLDTGTREKLASANVVVDAGQLEAGFDALASALAASLVTSPPSTPPRPAPTPPTPAPPPPSPPTQRVATTPSDTVASTTPKPVAVAVAPSDSAVAPNPTDVSKKGRVPLLPIVAGGIGIVAIAGGVVEGLSAQEQISKARQIPQIETESFDSAVRAARGTALTADILYLVGAAGIATGAALLWRDHGAADERAASPTRFSLSGGPTPNGVIASLRGSF
jgi:hypothetical protein